MGPTWVPKGPIWVPKGPIHFMKEREHVILSTEREREILEGDVQSTKA